MASSTPDRTERGLLTRPLMTRVLVWSYRNEPADKVTGMQWLEASTGIVWIWDDGKWLQFPAGSSGGGEVEWNDVLGKPLTFPPSTHGHEISEVNGLQDALDAAGGTPAWDDITGKPIEFPRPQSRLRCSHWQATNTRESRSCGTDNWQAYKYHRRITHDRYGRLLTLAPIRQHLRKHCAIATVNAGTIWTGTQAKYDNLTPDADTLYFITAGLG